MPRSDRDADVGLMRRLAGRLLLYFRLLRLDRPIGIWLLLWPTLWALWIASAGRPTAETFVVFVLGTVLLRSAGCAFNDFADRDIDSGVRRTASRPLASGAVKPVEAIVLFVALMLIALALVLEMNLLTVQLAVAGAVLAVVYPFMKRWIAAPQLVLGLAFAWGVPMAFAAATGSIAGRDLWLLFVCALIWVVIYDTEYAMADRDEDRAIGVRSTAILFGEMDVAIIAGLEIVFFAGMVLLGRSLAFGLWFWLGLIAAGLFALRQLWLIRERQAADCFRAFLNNAWFGGAIFVGIALDYLFRQA